MQQRQGSTIQDFIILDELGKGTFSVVYKVQSKLDGQIYAMQKVNIFTKDESKNVLNEIRLLTSLNSLYIVKFKDSFLGSDHKAIFLIMEFVSGGDLSCLLKQGNINGGIKEREIWKVLIQITLGVKMLHDNNILHRNLKLSNVFIDKCLEGDLYKIGYFDFSKFIKEANARNQVITTRENYSYPCDIWSIGCIIYELAAQKPPFRAADIQSLNKITKTGVYDPIPKKYSKDLSEVIKFLLKVNPLNRPSCDDILKNPLVIKKSGELLVEEEVGEKKITNLLQTIKLSQNLKELKCNPSKPKNENTIKKSNSQSIIRKNIDMSQTAQPIKQSEDVKPLQKPSQYLQQTEITLINKPPLIKPPISQPPKPKQPQTTQQLQNNVQQSQRLLGQKKNSNIPYQEQNLINPQYKSPRQNQQERNQNVVNNMPFTTRRQFSASPIGSR